MNLRNTASTQFIRESSGTASPPAPSPQLRFPFPFTFTLASPLQFMFVFMFLFMFALLIPACTRAPSSAANEPVTTPIAIRARPVEPSTQPPPQNTDTPTSASMPQTPPAAKSATQAPGLRAIFPHIRIDTAAKRIEIDAEVPIDPHDEQTPRIFLEQVLCTRNTIEHESLLVTDATASNVHAALLLLGVISGTPGNISWTPDDGLKRRPPTGPGINVALRYTNADGKIIDASPADWIVDAKTTTPLATTGATTGANTNTSTWIFAGSVVRSIMDESGKRAPKYTADLGGTLIGLCTFGTETLAFPRVLSPDSGIDEPLYIANPKSTPPVNTKVTVILTLAQ